MDSIIHSQTGLIHFIAAAIALITGTAVLLLKKGSDLHIKIGYTYIASMLGVNITAFMIYRLFGGFGVFHFAALVSLLTVLGGAIPAVFRIPENNWYDLHFSLMYWSVMGLYGAFAAEVLTRIPETPFLEMVGIATTAIMVSGGIYFGYKKEQWQELISVD